MPAQGCQNPRCVRHRDDAVLDLLDRQAHQNEVKQSAMTAPRKLRVLHYLNQFFAGIGGEEQAGYPAEVQAGAIGPGRLLATMLGEDHAIVGTVVCGDNFFQEERERAVEVLHQALRDLKPDVVVAGPAFVSGRYGLACAEVVKIAQEAGVPGVAGMNGENPAVPMFSRDIYIVATGPSPATMEPALRAMAKLVIKIGNGDEIGPAADEGYLPRGSRKLGFRDQPGYQRAVSMLMQKLRGEPFASEVPYQPVEKVTPAAPIGNLANATIALATTGGLIRRGNPDRQPASNSRSFLRIDVKDLDALTPTDFDAYHAGYYNGIAGENPNYILPLSYAQELKAAGEIGAVHATVYALAGVSTPVAECRRMGAEIAQDLVAAGVDGCLLVAT